MSGPARAMSRATLRAAWTAVGVLFAVNAGVLAVWPSAHDDGDDTASAATAVVTTVVPATAPQASDEPVATTVAPAQAASRNASSKAATATSSPAASALPNKTANVDRGDFLFDLGVTPACSPRLADMAATIRAVPGAYVSMIVAYSDGQSYGTMYAGPVQDDGTFVLKWKVPAAAATGTGHVLASGRDPAKNTSGQNVVEFTVVEGTKC